jgi:hypothetical protein
MLDAQDDVLGDAQRFGIGDAFFVSDVHNAF